MNTTSSRLSVLHLLLTAGETSAPYNEHCLAAPGKRDITVCTFFDPTVKPSDEMVLFTGRGSVMGFVRALRAALATREYDIIHAHTPHVGFLLLAASGLAIGPLSRSAVFTMHSCYQNFRKPRNRLMMVPIFASFRRVVCCSQASFNSLSPFYRLLAGDRLRAVPNGVDIHRVDRIAGREVRGMPDQDFTVASVGRLIEIKNPSSILSAFQRGADPPSELVFVGEGGLRDLLSRQIQARGLEQRVRLPGLVPRDSVYQELNAADLFVSASRREGLPVAVLEAMACRCPVVLSNITAHREIAAGVDFIPLIDPDDVDGFGREIKRFQYMSRSERKDIGEKCRRLAKERFSLDVMHERYGEIYSEVLTGNHSGAPSAFSTGGSHNAH